MRRLALVVGAGVAALWVASCSDQKDNSFPQIGDPPEAGPDAVEETDGGVSGDPSKGFLIKGTIIGPEQPYDGQVLVGPDGLIKCAEPGTVCHEDPAAQGVAIFETDVIAPGLIDAHNHILFDIFDNADWLPKVKYQNHDDWTKPANEPRYVVMVDVKQCLEDASQGKPTWCPTRFDGAGSLKCEMNKWGELKGLVAGTTSIVGLAGSALPCFEGLVRSVDSQYNGLGSDKMQTSALFPPSKTTADGVCKNYADGDTNAFLVHCGEGIDARSLAEFTTLGTATTTPDCLYAPQTVITHGTAFTAVEFQKMKDKGMKLVWSPASNMALYGQTTNIPVALDKGLLVALAPDWSMGGSQNMLDEMRAAKKVSDEKWGGRLKPEDIVRMSTTNAAVAIGLGDRLGKIAKGYVADLFGVKGDRAAPFDTIVKSTPKEVRFTMIGGKILYGDLSLKGVGGTSQCEEIADICETPKFVCVADPAKGDKQNQTYVQIKQALEGALKEIDTVRPDIGTGANFAPLAPVFNCGMK